MSESIHKYDLDSLPPMLRGYLRVKSSYPDHFILIQVGDFYEVFFDDAVEVSSILDIRLTSRNKEKANSIPMCGVPLRALTTYLPTLLNSGASVVIVSQDESESKKNINRSITRIITPGVRFHEDGIDSKSLNYLAAAYIDNSGSGSISYFDISCGALKVVRVWDKDQLVDNLTQVSPSEILYPGSYNSHEIKQSWVAESRKISKAKYNAWTFSSASSRDIIQSLSNKGLNFTLSKDFASQLETLTASELVSVKALLEYVKDLSLGAPIIISNFQIIDSSSAVFVDAATQKNLELFESSYSRNKSHSLIGVIDKTSTSMGSRLLKQRLINPFTTKEQLESYYDAIDELGKRPEIVDGLKDCLLKIRDIQRISLKLVQSSNLSPKDLGALRDSLLELPSIKFNISQLPSALFNSLGSNFDPHESLSLLLTEALKEELPNKLSDGGIFKDTYNSELRELRELAHNSGNLLISLEGRLKEETEISNLKIKYNGVLGYFIEVSKSNESLVPEEFIQKQSLKNVHRYKTSDLTSFESKIFSANAKLLNIEKSLFNELRREVSKFSSSLLEVSSVLAEVDILVCFTEVSAQNRYTRPQLSSKDDFRLSIQRGRNPIVEKVIGSQNYTPNDVELSSSGNRFAILTGANMGGKSTYLRQVGICQVMAQVGCFVPAEEATLPVVDRVFTRIGANDDTSAGDSTFMVEMREVSSILKNATEMSLVLIDEVGRGTATKDGLAIAQAISEWIYDYSGSLTIFATHFHELTELAKLKQGMQSLSVGVREEGGEVVFTHKIEKRPADRSYGLEVAKLAGLPKSVIDRATEIVHRSDESPSPVAFKTKVESSDSGAVQSKLDRLIIEINKKNVQDLTLIEAIGELHRIQSIINK